MNISPTLIQRTIDVFERAIGQAPTVIVQAPGRVNLIGEHTDYNDGFVLPCAIDRHTVIAARARGDRLVRVIAADYDGQADTFALDAPIERLDAPMWANYVRGVVQALARRGVPLQGVDMVVAGDIPRGAGLSSSASLSVAVCRLFAGLPGAGQLGAIELALAAQAAENDFVGTKCGNMDQISSAAGVDGHALLIDCRSLAVQPVRIAHGAAIVIIDSRVQRGLVDSAYNARRRQCEAAARHFGVPALRDLDSETVEARGHELEPEALRRVRHVVSENARVLAAGQALAAGDLARMGELMAASHASMRDDFEITIPPIDRLVQIVKDRIGTAGGVRMTGGGFGGCVVALVPEALVDPIRVAVEQDYRSPGGERATVHVCRAASGAAARPAIDTPLAV
ncbi:galactokinase [Telluria beijingensis]|uniref:galactokinase n=1 Tax=Telluria beijingensis TaxID=3068633 RepID=UPI00279580EC|nr:galactokinase [Massilia sp. REN29]